MRLQQIQNNYLYEGLDRSATISMLLWESAGSKLREAALTADQIQQIFQNIEQGATAAGDNRTLLGKGKDAAQAVDQAWENLKTKIQNSGPIKNYDDAYDATVAKIEAGLGGPDNAINKVIQKYRKFAKEHPIAQGFIYSALIAAAGISGAGLGGAAVLGLLKMADKLLQGEKFSSAAYSGAKTGALAYGASKIGDLIKGGGDQQIPGDGQVADPNAPGYDADSAEFARDKADLTGNANQANVDTAYDKNIPKTSTAPTGSAEIVDKAKDVDAANVSSATGKAVKGAGADMFKGLASDPMADATIKRIADGIAAGRLSTSDLQHLQASQGFIANALSNADPAREAALTAHYNVLDKMLRAANDIAVESRIRYADTTGRLLSEGQVYMIFNRVCARNDQLLSEGKLIEGPLDAIKGMAGKAMGAVAGKAKQIGTNLTTKVTADKLNSAWQKAGAPTDSEEVKAFLTNQNVNPDVINKVFTDLKISATPTAKADSGGYAEIKKSIMQLNNKDRQRMIQYLTKQLGTT